MFSCIMTNKYLSLYKRVHNYNKHFSYTESVFLIIQDDIYVNICCHYIRRYIMTTNVSFIHESVFSLYKTMCNNNNIYFCFIMKINIVIIHESVFLLYETMYNRNICCHYIRRYIMTTNIS